MKPCLTCGHYANHSSTGIQYCMSPTCLCTRPTYDQTGENIWRIRKEGDDWTVLRRDFLTGGYNEIGFYKTHEEAIEVTMGFIRDDPFEEIRLIND